MLLRQIGCLTILLFITSPLFANMCPPAEQVASCRGGDCAFQRVPGWSAIVYYTDHGKSFAFQKERVDYTSRGREINCFYSYLDPDTNRLMPPAIVLRSIIN